MAPKTQIGDSSRNYPFPYWRAFLLACGLFLNKSMFVDAYVDLSYMFEETLFWTGKMDQVWEFNV
jgi:hypothetical protein